MMSARKLALTTVTPHSTAFSYFFPLGLQRKPQHTTNSLSPLSDTATLTETVYLLQMRKEEVRERWPV